MSLTTYESSIKTISSNEEVVFRTLSNLNNLEQLKSRIPQDKLEDLQFDADSVSFNVTGIGRIGFRIIDREPNKTIKFETENSPIAVNLWIQLKQLAENDTRMKLTLKADLPSMVKIMVDKKLKDGIEQIATVLAAVPYGDL